MKVKDFKEVINGAERSLSLVMRDAQDKGREAFSILKDYHAGCSKPRIVILYNELTTLQKLSSESITDYIIRAETSATALRSADEIVSDALLVAIVLKGLPNECKSFIAVVTQPGTVHCLQNFKQALRSFEEAENSKNY